MTIESLRDQFLRYNKGYNWEDSANIEEINKQIAIDGMDLHSLPAYQNGGGDVIASPWGSNKALDAGKYPENYTYAVDWRQIVNPHALEHFIKKPEGHCSKELVVNSGNMLSLQRHRGRQEYWAVEEGELTVILNEDLYTVRAGKAIFIPLGAVHCMINMSDEPVKVVELQTGICREADNVRLKDFSGRPTYFLSNSLEEKAAHLYQMVENDIRARAGMALTHS